MDGPDKKIVNINRDLERSRVRHVVIGQYMLHEVQHHSLQHTGSPSLIPKAHSPMDIYKCLHQGEFGVGHSLDYPKRFRQRLVRETMEDEPEEGAQEPALEDISAEGRVLRVNLRAFRGLFNHEIDKRIDQLAQVCFESAETARGSETRFRETLAFFKDLNQANELRIGRQSFAFPGEMVDRFLLEVHDLTRRLGQVPIFGHSPDYRRLNHPAYRVVDRTVLEKSPLAGLLKKTPEPTR
ncbi:MAG: hypothetical protein HY879_04030 [Deltaproteobacteria bacterium]|nr:hypothetical protein [Deltaproteobacteria bacterium]